MLNTTAIGKEFTINNKFIESFYPFDASTLKVFKEAFPLGVKVSEIPKVRPVLMPIIGDGEYAVFIMCLLDALPRNKIPLKITGNEIQDIDDLFYNGDIVIEGDVNLIDTQVHLMGNLTVSGKLTVSGTGYIQSRDIKNIVSATEINLNDNAMICASLDTEKLNMAGESIIASANKIDTVNMYDYSIIHICTDVNNLNMFDNAKITTRLKVNIARLAGGEIFSELEANAIYNTGCLIQNNVYAKIIENTGKGKILGAIKCN